MRFRIVLWILGFMLERASKNNPRFRRKLEGHDLTLEIGCREGYARHFIIQEQKVMSYPGKASAPGASSDQGRSSSRQPIQWSTAKISASSRAAPIMVCRAERRGLCAVPAAGCFGLSCGL